MVEPGAFVVAVALGAWLLGRSSGARVSDLRAWRWPRPALAHLALHSLLLSVAVQRAVVWGNGGLVRSAPELALLAIAAVASLLSLRQTGSLLRDEVMIGYVAFAVTLVPGAFVAADALGAATFWFRLVPGILVLAAVRQALSVVERQRLLHAWVLWLLAAVLVALAAHPAANLASKPSFPFFAVSARLPTVSGSGVGWLGVCLIAFAAFGLDHIAGRVTRTRRSLLVIAGLAAVFSGQYRAGIAALVWIVVLWVVVAGAPHTTAITNKTKGLVVAALVAVVALAAVPAPWSPLSAGVDSGPALGTRQGIWRVGADELDVAPVFGRGMNSVVSAELKPLFPTDWVAIRQIHNTWLDVALGGGFVSLGVLIAIVATMAMLAVRTGGRFGYLAIAIGGAALIESLVAPSFDRPGWVWVTVLMVTTMGHDRRVDSLAMASGAGPMPTNLRGDE